jgi:hypothetical protein
MESSVYKINKGINRPIEFRGLKAQYIWWLAGGILALLMLFVFMYLCGLNGFICLGIVFFGGAWVFGAVYRMSYRFGEFGMMKRAAGRKIPRVIRSRSRKNFILRP